MDLDKIIQKDPEVLGGATVFARTRVPIETFFDHLEQEISVSEFLDDFPSVSKEQVSGILELASKLLASKNMKLFYA
jgi:uncharacterized protein (DUF433 family)